MSAEYLCHVAPRLSLDGDGEPDPLLHDDDLVGGHRQLSHLGGQVQRPLLGHDQEVAVRVVEACGDTPSMVYNGHLKNFRLVCPLEFPYMVHATSLI